MRGFAKGKQPRIDVIAEWIKEDKLWRVVHRNHVRYVPRKRQISFYYQGQSILYIGRGR